MTLDDLTKKLSVTLTRDTIVVFKVPREEGPTVGKCVDFYKTEFARHNVTALVCPLDYEIVIINPRKPRKKKSP